VSDSDDAARDAKRRRDAINARARRAERRAAREKADAQAFDDAAATGSVVAIETKIPAGRLYRDHVVRVAIVAQRIFADPDVNDIDTLRALTSASATLARAVEVVEMKDEIERIERHLQIGRYTRRVS
jgi:phage terminase Nu1 subunit (DNA packaging protein)